MTNRLPSSKNEDVLTFGLAVSIAFVCTLVGGLSTNLWSYFFYALAGVLWLGSIGSYLDVCEYSVVQFLSGSIGLFFIFIAFFTRSLFFKVFWGALGLLFIIHPIYKVLKKENGGREYSGDNETSKSVESLDIDEKPSNLKSMSTELSDKIEDAKRRSKDIEFINVEVGGKLQQIVPNSKEDQILVNICSKRKGMTDEIEKFFDVSIADEHQEYVVYEGFEGLDEALSLIEISFNLLDIDTDEVEFTIQPHGISLTNFSEGMSSNKHDIGFGDLSDDEFERLVAKIWEGRGWNTEVTSSSLDKGIDVVAEKNDVYEKKALIQVKNYSEENKVSSKEIQQYASLKQQEDNVDEVILVTKSGFTSHAKDRAQDLNVKLVSGEKLEKLFDEYISSSY